MSLKWFPVFVTVAMSGSAAAASDWQYIATFYGWFPGVSSNVETPVGDIDAEVEFAEVLEALDVAFLGAFESRKGRLSLIGDIQFFDIGVEAEAPTGMLFSDAEVDSQMTLFSAYATYAMIDNADFRVDVGGGLRYTDATIDTLLVGQATTPDASFSASGGWTDVLIAARVNRQFNDRWYGVAYADVGGFGIGDSSDLTWQGFGGVGFRFHEEWSAVGGYRHLTIERDFDGVDTTTDVSGPFLGVQASF